MLSIKLIKWVLVWKDQLWSTGGGIELLDVLLTIEHCSGIGYFAIKYVVIACILLKIMSDYLIQTI